MKVLEDTIIEDMTVEEMSGERRQLVVKKYMEGLTLEENFRLLFLSDQLDELDYIELKSGLDKLEELAIKYEEPAKKISRAEARLLAQRNRKRIEKKLREEDDGNETS